MSATLPVTPPVEPVTPPATPPAVPPTPPEQSVPYARFKEINDAKTALETRIAELTTKAGDTDKLQAQIADLNTSLVRQRVALAKGIPAELADRLTGKDEAEMTADADKLLQFIGKPKAPKINGDTKNDEKPTYTMAQLNDSAFYQKNEADILQAFTDGRIVK